jgi:LysR family transcriptional regulator (chromosome initiation inhibitor)
VEKWFPEGFSISAAEKAPCVMFTRKDMLHYKILKVVFGHEIKVDKIHYVPSIEQFTQMINSGYAYGMVPDWQSESVRSRGELVEVHEKAHDLVNLYWHCWNIESAPLDRFTKQLIGEAKTLLI